jgi:uncharacterized protein YcbK (DUF882 family)
MMSRATVAILFAVGMFPARAAYANQPDEDGEAGPAGDGVEGGDEAERPEDAAPETPAADGEAGKAPGKAKATSRRSGKGKGKHPRVSGHVVPESQLRNRRPPPPSGNIYLHRPVEKESLKINIFNPDGSYNIDAVKAASHMLRCRRTDTQKDMEPRLLTILSHVYDNFGERRIDIVSGFRNQRKTTSYHYKGTASDIRVDGVKPSRLKAFVETLDAGGMGIGIYPVTGFVHIDVRPPPSYRWVDYSPSNPDATSKRPPRGFKKKRLQS